MRQERPELDLVHLLRRAISGDDHALERLLAYLYVPVRRFLSRRLDGGIDNADLQDLAQEILIRIAQNLQQCTAEADGQLVKWCLVIARNAIVDYARSSAYLMARMRTGADPDSISSGTSQSGAVENAVASTADDALLRLLMDAHEALPSETAHLLWLRLIESAPWSDVAAELGTTTDGVKRRFQRAQRALRKAVLKKVEDLSEAERERILVRLRECGVREESLQ